MTGRFPKQTSGRRADCPSPAPAGLLYGAARKAPLSTAAAMAVLFSNSDFGDHRLYFASGEARAHLNHLVTTGQLTRQTDADGTDWFVS